MAKVWFQNSNGDEKVIAECMNWLGVTDAIHNFINSCNVNKPVDKQFKCYYMRTWEECGRMKIDVGSWSEFFYTDLKWSDRDDS